MDNGGTFYLHSGEQRSEREADRLHASNTNVFNAGSYTSIPQKSSRHDVHTAQVPAINFHSLLSEQEPLKDYENFSQLHRNWQGDSIRRVLGHGTCCSFTNMTHQRTKLPETLQGSCELKRKIAAIVCIHLSAESWGGTVTSHGIECHHANAWLVPKKFTSSKHSN